MGEMADLILKAAEQARRLTALEAENAELKADNRLLRDELSAAEAERDEAREGWKEAVQWLCRLEGAGRASMPHWEKEHPWLFEREEG